MRWVILLLVSFRGQCHGDRKYTRCQRTSSRMNELGKSHKNLAEAFFKKHCSSPGVMAWNMTAWIICCVFTERASFGIVSQLKRKY